MAAWKVPGRSGPPWLFDQNAVKEHGLNVKEADRCKNFFALGMTYWLFNRDVEVTKEWIRGKFKQPYRRQYQRADGRLQLCGHH